MGDLVISDTNTGAIYTLKQAAQPHVFKNYSSGTTIEQTILTVGANSTTDVLAAGKVLDSGQTPTSTNQLVNKSYADTLAPTGSVMAYMGTADPTGWVICDGIVRTDGAAGKYTALINMGIGTGPTANYTPPDYRGAFLRGAGTGTNASYAGPAVKASQAHATQTHSHGISNFAHTHSLSAHTHTIEHTHTYPTTGGVANGQGGAWNSGFDGNSTKTSSQPSNASSGGPSTDTTGQATQTPTIDNSTTSVNANETRPFNYGVNWILKC
jgi:hypothetical protein